MDEPNRQDRTAAPARRGIIQGSAQLSRGELGRPVLTHRDLSLLETGTLPFSAPGWIFELKYAGYRCLGKHAAGLVRLISWQGRDISRRFPELIAELAQLPPGTAIDGELVLFGDGPQLDALRSRLAVRRTDAIVRASRETPVAMAAWDILMHAGEDVRHLPLLRRKALLERVLHGMERVVYADHVEADGDLMCAKAIEQGLEGIVAKRADSRYTAGRTPDWVKIETP